MIHFTTTTFGKDPSFYMPTLCVRWTKILLFLGVIQLSSGLEAQESLAPTEATKPASSPTVEPSPLDIPGPDVPVAGSGTLRRHDGFKRVWRSRRETFAANAETSKGAVVFLGDSITQGWRDDFRNDFAPMKAANRGISGDTTRGMLHRLEEDVIALEPSCVVVLAGTNDLAEKDDTETIASNMKLIIAKIREHQASIPIVLCQVFPSSEKKKRPSSEIIDLNKRYQMLASEDAHTICVDTWTLFADAKGNAKPEEFPDLLHPNRDGYAKWKAALIPIFEALGLKEVEPEAFECEPGFELLFNEKDLSGWGYRVTPESMRKGRENWLKSKDAPVWPLVEQDVAFENQKETPDRRFVAVNGRLVVTMPRAGRCIQQLWTTQEFDGDFELRLDFRATPNADSGVFIRQPQLQCRDFVLAGPYKDLRNYKPQQWNSLTVVVKDDVARCLCNDEVIEEALKVPANGPIGLEGDRGQIEYRRIRIKRL
jgi:lysophospholipase L1-like esterase